MKNVIFNADDFGALPRTNAAILRAHVEGLLTSTSLMVTEPAAAEAIEIARAHPTLAVGLHVALSNAHSALPPERIPALVGPGGRFEDDPVRAALRHSFSRAARAQIPAEIEEQFARFAATGLPFSHVDGHQHLHLIPPAWPHVLRLAEQYAVKRVRIPYEECRPFSPARRRGRRLEWLFLQALGKRRRAEAAVRGFLFADRVYGQMETGRMTAAYVQSVLGALGGELNEIYLHPGTDHAQPLPAGPAGMDVDLDALISPQVRARVSDLGIRLTSFRDLANV